jgi:hypothetical protein
MGDYFAQKANVVLLDQVLGQFLVKTVVILPLPLNLGDQLHHNNQNVFTRRSGGSLTCSLVGSFIDRFVFIRQVEEEDLIRSIDDLGLTQFELRRIVHRHGKSASCVPLTLQMLPGIPGQWLARLTLHATDIIP